MPTEPSQRSRWALVFFALSMLAVPALFGGCGRSALDDTFTAFDAGPGDATTDGARDATPDAGACTPQTCPNGCCDATGVCRAGTDLTACGSFGQTCANCPSAGFDFCDVKSHACGRTVAKCDAQSCADGCCENGLCLSGADPNDCGAGGKACQHCAAQGQTCDGTNRVCTGPACGPATCKGCCVGDLCAAGTDPNACGRLGAQCQNCAAQGTSCQPVAPGGVCEGQPTCGPQNCAGCCIGNLCVTGQDQTECGLAGQQCQNCGAFGSVCQSAGPGKGGFCAAPTCGPENCKTCCLGNTCMPESDGACGIGGGQCFACPPGSTCSGGICVGQTLCNPQTCPTGCCIGNICAVGTQDTACGIGGEQCQSCRAFGETCQGQACVQTCGPQNCAGCCLGNQCVPGGVDAQCGVSGQQCTDCAASGLVCRSGICETPPPPCDPTSCPGCCDAQSGCVPGFLNTQCGSGGATCTNCAQLGSTCDVSVTPRVCKNQQTTCPAPYGSCPVGVSTASPTVQHVCSTTDLQNARAACAGGASSAGCQQYFQFEEQFNPSCAACLQPFDAGFNDLTGLFACVAPFVSAQCDHSTGCAIDCQTQSCAQCPPGGGAQCRNDVRNNQCSTYFQQSQCVAQAFFGSASFCNPNNYGGSFGGWLQGVGGHYCGP